MMTQTYKLTENQFYLMQEKDDSKVVNVVKYPECVQDIKVLS